MISNGNAHVKTAYGVNVKKHNIVMLHLFISRHLNQIYFTNLPNNINRFVSTEACLFSGLLVHNSYFSSLFLPQGHLAVFQWRLTLLQNLAKTYFYFEGVPLKC